MRPIWKDLKVDLEQSFSYYVSHPTKGETPARYTDAYNKMAYGVIDHVLIGPRSKLVAVKGGLIEMDKANPLSDHKPVWAELAVK
jgi:endonuclease/exonuclease/phosphatase family metal-dependent hydrolase